jgi:hypothetical protein
MPKCPGDLSEPAYASVAFDALCQARILLLNLSLSFLGIVVELLVIQYFCYIFTRFLPHSCYIYKQKSQSL